MLATHSSEPSHRRMVVRSLFDQVVPIHVGDGGRCALLRGLLDALPVDCALGRRDVGGSHRIAVARRNFSA